MGSLSPLLHKGHLMLTLDQFWKIVEDVNWESKPDTYKVKGRLLRELGSVENVKRLNTIYARYSRLIYNKLDKYDRYLRETSNRGFGLGDDSFGDNVSEVISKGREFVRLVFDNPEIGYRMAIGGGRNIKSRQTLEEKIPELKKYGNWNDFHEKFSYCLPYRDDFKYIQTKAYKERATEYLEGKIHDYGNGDVVEMPPLSSGLIDDEIKELQDRINQLNDLKGAMGTLREGLKLVQSGCFLELREFLDRYVSAAKALSKAEVIHYGAENMFNDIERFDIKDD